MAIHEPAWPGVNTAGEHCWIVLIVCDRDCGFREEVTFDYHPGTKLTLHAIRFGLRGLGWVFEATSCGGFLAVCPHCATNTVTAEPKLPEPHRPRPYTRRPGEMTMTAGAAA